MDPSASAVELAHFSGGNQTCGHPTLNEILSNMASTRSKERLNQAWYGFGAFLTGGNDDKCLLWGGWPHKMVILLLYMWTPKNF